MRLIGRLARQGIKGLLRAAIYPEELNQGINLIAKKS